MSNKIPLSQRIRPNSEAAPWVIEEVKKMEQQIEQLESGMKELQRRLRDKNKRIAELVDRYYIAKRDCKAQGEGMKELAEKWRKEAGNPAYPGTEWNHWIAQCADELDALRKQE